MQSALCTSMLANFGVVEVPNIKFHENDTCRRIWRSW